MPVDIERLIKLEITQDYHAKRIGLLEAQGIAFGKALTAIQGNLNQIKWLGYGAAAGFVAHEIGILNFIKGIL